VAIRPARYFSFDGRSRPFVRLGFAALDERELIEAVKLLAQAAKAIGVSM
jgi:GntR family transcriptional regulator/MocR family aminotransferase